MMWNSILGKVMFFYFFPFFLWIVNKKPCMPPTNPLNLYINLSIYIGPNTLFSPNLMIIITGTFKNTANPLKLYEITLFFTGSLAYYAMSYDDGIYGHQHTDDDIYGHQHTVIIDHHRKWSTFTVINFKCVPRVQLLPQRSEIFRHFFQHHNGYEFKLETKSNISKISLDGPLKHIL